LSLSNNSTFSLTLVLFLTGYDELTQATDFTKSTYINQPQNKVTGVSGLLNG
jgi:hypothetical protein